ncbi:MAG TPA: N(G),N(G)-dimethylarginine dimethylaminohydrolase [Gaiellaceae bacterium]
MKALVRRPSPRLDEGIVTHLERRPVDVELARAQWVGYVQALENAGWETVEAPPADESPDGVFVEDAVVVFGHLAVLARPGVEARRSETVGVEAAVAELGYAIERIEEPGTLDGGDVLKIGDVVYVGRSGRTNADGARRLRELLAPLGATVVEVPVRRVLHLKSAVTALPDGSILGHPAIVPPAFRDFVAVPEESGAHVVLLRGGKVMLAADCPRTAELIAARGYDPVIVDISEFQKLEGCVTCLSVRFRRAVPA